MFKVNLLILFLFLTVMPLLARFPMSDLVLEPEYNQADTISVNRLNQKCWSLRRMDPKLAIAVGKESLELAKSTGYGKGEVQVLNYLGICYLRLDDSRTASEYFFNALNHSDSLGLSIEKGYALSNIGSSLLFEGEYNQALTFAHKSLALQIQNKDRKGIAYAWMRMSDVYNRLQKFDSLLITAQIAYDLLTDLEMKENSLIALKNIGRAWEGKKQYGKALACYLEIINADSISKATVHNVYPDLTNIYNLLNLPDQAILYGEKWMSTEKENDRILRNMADSYGLKADWKEAFRYARMSISVMDSLAKKEQSRQIKNLQILYETRETEQENVGLKVKLDVKNLYMSAFAVIILLIGLLLLILVSKRNQQKRLYKILNQKNEEISVQRDHLEELNQTKDKLFSIIAHDLRGPIGNTSAFLEVLTTNESEFTKKELLGNLILLKNSSKATFRLLENLLTWALAQRGEIIFRPMQNDLYKLIQSNTDLFASNAENKKIQMVNELNHPLVFEFDHEMINTVIRNLINNAIKYTGENGRITISVNEMDDTIEISVNDTGIGMDSETVQLIFISKINKNRKVGTKGEKGTGLGLTLCKEFVAKHHGIIGAESKSGIGSTFKFTLPRSHPKIKIA